MTVAFRACSETVTGIYDSGIYRYLSLFLSPPRPVTPRPLFLPHLLCLRFSTLSYKHANGRLQKIYGKVSLITKPAFGPVPCRPLSSFLFCEQYRSTMLKLGFTGDVVIRYWKESQSRL